MNPSSPEPYVRAKSTQVGRRTPPYRPHMVAQGFAWRPLPRLTLKAGRREGCRAEQ